MAQWHSRHTVTCLDGSDGRRMLPASMDADADDVDERRCADALSANETRVSLGHPRVRCRSVFCCRVKIRKSVPLRRHIQENPVVDRDARQRVACAAGLGAAGDFFAPNDQKRDLLTKNETTFLRAATGRRKIVRKKRLLSVVVVTRRLSRRAPASAMTGCCRVRLLPSS